MGRKRLDAKLVSFTCRLPQEVHKELPALARRNGHPTPAHLIRAKLNEVVNRSEQADRYGQSILRLERLVRRSQAQQTATAELIDVLLQTMLVNLPKPAPEALDGARAAAKAEHDKLLQYISRRLGQKKSLFQQLSPEANDETEAS